MERALLTPEEAAERIGIDVAELAELRTDGVGPEYFTVLVRVVRYEPDSVDDFARRHRTEYSDLDALASDHYGASNEGGQS